MKLNCHGCDGKGWVMVVTQERITPFFNNVDGARVPVEGFAVATRECAAQDCPICHGTGTYTKKEETT